MSDAMPDFQLLAERSEVFFAQVREDPLVDLDVIARCPGGEKRIVLIASGGCTACACATAGAIASIDLVDVSPAQLVLAVRKLDMVRKAIPFEHAMAQLGHGVAGERLDFEGRYEWLFAELQWRLRAIEGPLDNLLSLRDPTEQLALAEPTSPLGAALNESFSKVFALPRLVKLFGASATSNRHLSFEEHFLQRLRWALGRFPAAENAWLHQMLRGRFPQNTLYPWLQFLRDGIVPTCFPDVQSYHGNLLEVLRQLPGSSREFIHFSNVLDWVSVDEARQSLSEATRVLVRGGWLLVRQLNSTLPIAQMNPRELMWDLPLSNELNRNDRSFFYRSHFAGTKA